MKQKVRWVLGGAVIAIGSVCIISQSFRMTPNLIVFWSGVVIVVLGMLCALGDD